MYSAWLSASMYILTSLLAVAFLYALIQISMSVSCTAQIESEIETFEGISCDDFILSDSSGI